MKVKNINWISKEDKEAEVLITDGIFTVTCFCHPCDLNIGDKVERTLFTLDNKVLGKVENKREAVIEHRSTFIHLLRVKVKDVAGGIVLLGNIQLEVDNLPGDLKKNDIIEVLVDRIDI